MVNYTVDCFKSYKSQGAKDQTETIWKYANKFIELDEKKKGEGNELDEFQV